MKSRIVALPVLLGLTALVGCSSLSKPPVVVPSLASQSGGTVSPGEFVWHDLITPDADEALAFYGELFGWSFRSTDDGYFEIYSDGNLIGGIVDSNLLGTTAESALWLNSLASEDLEEALAGLVGAGGDVLSPAAKLPHRGKVALVEDPQGAIVQLVQITKKDRLPDPAVWIWHELLSDDPAESAAWYGSLSGVTVVENSEGERYDLIDGDSVLASISQSPFEATRSVWVPVIAVADLQSFVDQVPGAGGRVVISPESDLSDGTVAVILDPSGGVFAVQSKEVVQ